MQPKVKGSPCAVTIKTKIDHPHRTVALLEHSAPYVNIKGIFDSLSLNEQRYYFKSFDYWLGGFHNDGRFHGWNKTQHQGKYTQCIVFKNVSEGERLYGFICRPKAEDPNHEMCVLVLYAQKRKWKTDTAELDRAEMMRKDPDVQAALRDPELFKKGVGKKK